jgi:phosphoribosylanthranilate isomerase
MKRNSAIKLKVCGMRDEDNIHEVAALRPDYLGFIFYKQSPRFVGENFSMPTIQYGIKRVGVFVNDDVGKIMKLYEKHNLDFIQLHGNETVNEVIQLRKSGAGIIKVFSIHDDFDFEETKRYAEYSDYFLFDTKGKYFGGNALQFNWTILERFDQQLPFFLSGGLNIENIAAVTELSSMNLHALDINSGVEVSPAIKDRLKVAEVMSKLESINKEKSEI